MDERTIQFRTGVVVIAALLLAAILVVLFGEFGFGRKKTIHVMFDHAPGTTVETPVRKSGILVGRVRAVEFDPQGRVRVTVQVNDDVPIGRDDRCQIKSSLLGSAVLEFVPGHDPALAGQLLTSGETIEGSVIDDPLAIIASLKDDLGKTVRSVGSAGEEVSRLAGKINQLIGDGDGTGQRPQILARFDETLTKMSATFDAINGLLGDQSVQAQLRTSLNELPALMTEARETMSGFKQALAAAQTNLEDLQGFTGPLGDRGKEIVAQMEGGVEDLREALKQVAAFSKAINSREGTVGQLVHDQELYNRLNLAAANIQKASVQLRPILSDVRVFTDKIARDPSQVGVGGVIRERTGIK